MRTRVAASLLALTVLVAPGLTGGVAYLCLLDGNVRSTCCCEPSGEKPDCEHSQVEPAGCCEGQVADAKHPPATSERIKRDSQPPPVLLATLPFVEVLPPATREAALPPGARGPPSAGPPLFTWNCSYLI